VLYRALDKAAVGLDAASVLDGIVTPALIEAQPGWSTVAFSAGTWSPATLSYRKDSIGRVLIKPLIYTLSGSNLVAPQAVATLPAGSRPGVKSYFVGQIPASGVGTTAHIAWSIATNGVVTLESSTAFVDSGFGQRVTFPNVEFRAEN
jgi:hypothetical protein